MAQANKSIRVIRTIVIQGELEWVKKTLENSYINEKQFRRYKNGILSELPRKFATITETIEDFKELPDATS